MPRWCMTKTMRWCALIALASAAFAMFPAPAAAETFIVYFPWVPNGETIDGTGPWSSEVSLQNLNGVSCPLTVYAGQGASWVVRAQFSLKAAESRSISSKSLAVPNPGSPLRIQAQCPISASLKQVTPDVVHFPWSDGAAVVTGYTAVAQADVIAARASATAGWHLPIIQTNSQWDTFIRVTNLYATGSTDVTVELYPSGNTDGADGADAVLTKRLGVAETWTIDALASLGIEGWVGYARITANHEVVALALRSKAETSMALTNVAVAGDAAGAAPQYTTSAPLLFTAFNGWNTGINLANIADRPTSVAVRYYANNGALVSEDFVNIPARGMTYLYTPGNVSQESFVGSAMIVSDTPVVAAIDEVKYETTEGLSYLAGGVPQTDVAIPIAFREDPANGRHDNSGINVANLNPDAAQTVTIALATITGAEILPPFDLTIPPGSSNFVYLPFVEGVPAGTVASARLRSNDPLGFVAVSNDVNYAVAGDGSVVFSATGAAGYFHIPEPVVP